MHTFKYLKTRGGGFLNVFLALDCVKSRKFKKSDDMEKQEVVMMTQSELQSAVLSQSFLEAKWTQTISMALLWLAGNDGGKLLALNSSGSRFLNTFA